MAVKASATITLSFMVDVKAVYRYYKLQASTASAPTKPTSNPPSGWTDTEPSYTSRSTNTLYFVDLTILTNDTWSYSAVSKSSSYEAAKEAYNKAQNAQDTANEVVTRVANAETSITKNADAIELRATKTEVTEAVSNIQVGGRNLLIGTSNSVTHTGTGSTNQCTQLYMKSDYYNGIFVLEGKQFTLSFDWETTATSGKFIVLTNDTPWADMSEYITPSSTNQSGKSVFTFTCGSKWDTGAYTGIRVRSDNLTGTITIKNAMLELGNKPSSWQPAPEDVDSSIETAKKYTDAQIKVSADGIKSEVSETYVTKDDASSTYAKSTDLKQTSDSFQMNFKTLQTTVLDNQHNVDEQFSELNDYIRFQGGNIILGKSGNSITCKITNDRLSFMQDDVEVAYLSNNQLYINKANVTNKLQIGNFVFQAKSDGGMSVVKNT